MTPVRVLSGCQQDDTTQGRVLDILFCAWRPRTYLLTVQTLRRQLFFFLSFFFNFFSVLRLTSAWREWLLHTVAAQHLQVLGGHRQPRTWAATCDTRGGTDTTRAWGSGGYERYARGCAHTTERPYNSETRRTRLKLCLAC